MLRPIIRTFIENISPIMTQGTGPNPREYAKMKIIMRIIDRLPNVFSGILTTQNAKPAEHKHIVTAEDINNIRRPIMSMMVIATPIIII